MVRGILSYPPPPYLGRVPLPPSSAHVVKLFSCYTFVTMYVEIENKRFLICMFYVFDYTTSYRLGLHGAAQAD